MTGIYFRPTTSMSMMHAPVHDDIDVVLIHSNFRKKIICTRGKYKINEIWRTKTYLISLFYVRVLIWICKTSNVTFSCERKVKKKGMTFHTCHKAWCRRGGNSRTITIACNLRLNLSVFTWDSPFFLNSCLSMESILYCLSTLHMCWFYLNRCVNSLENILLLV